MFGTKIKKTYVIAFIAAVLAAAEQLGYHIPDAVYALLGAAGLASTRAAISKVEQNQY